MAAVSFGVIALALTLALQLTDTTAYTPAQCPDCAGWNEPAAASRLFGNTWYVGTRGLTAILVTSSAGHVLIDGGLPESAPLIMQSIRTLGFRVEDIRVIGNSHTHYDHSGGLAALQRASGAEVVALPRAAPVLSRGRAARDDPQHDILLPFPPVRRVRAIADGDSVVVGPIRLTAHATEGHAPGGTTWTWRACEGTRCVQFVFGDSQSAISAPGFSYVRSGAAEDFERGIRVLEGLPCDVLVTPHPGASNLLERMAGRAPLVGAGACRRYAATARAGLARRLMQESVVGTWRMVRYETWDASGVRTEPLGRRPGGYVVLDGGRALVQLADSGGSGGFAAYFGRYRLQPLADSVVLAIEVEGGNVPGYPGTTQLRPFRVNGDTLTLGTAGEYRATLIRVR